MSMPMREVSATMATFLQGVEQEVLTVTGGWGVGKTYLWNELLAQQREAQTLGIEKYGYVSLFSVSSLELLKLALFESTVLLAREAQPTGRWRKLWAWLVSLASSLHIGGGKALVEQLASDLVTLARVTCPFTDGMSGVISNATKEGLIKSTFLA